MIIWIYVYFLIIILIYTVWSCCIILIHKMILIVKLIVCRLVKTQIYNLTVLAMLYLKKNKLFYYIFLFYFLDRSHWRKCRIYCNKRHHGDYDDRDDSRNCILCSEAKTVFIIHEQCWTKLWAANSVQTYEWVWGNSKQNWQ